MNGLIFARNANIYNLCHERLKPYLETLLIERGITGDIPPKDKKDRIES